MAEPEAKQFLAAWQNYLRHHSIAATQKTVDLMTALSVTAFLYGPRLVAVTDRRRGRRQNRPAAQAPSGSPGYTAPIFRFVPPSGPVRSVEPVEPAGPAPERPADPPAYEPEADAGGEAFH